jgi:xylitol oxidase
MTERMTNWAGNVTFRAERFHRPPSVEALQQLVAGSDHVRALGTGHSFNRLADSRGDLVSVAGLPATIELDTSRGSVTVAAGIRYGELAVHLHAKGFALHNLASLPHISVAGACSTGTHGSGDRIGNLATAVSELELVTASGDVVVARRGDERFEGTVVALGALGVVTSLTLDIVPSFEVAQHVYEDLPRAALDEHWAEILSAAYSVSLFTDWTGPRINQVWLKRRVGEPDGWAAPPRWMGATLAGAPLHPVAGMSAVHCTEQLGAAGPWHERLPHFKLGFTPSSGEELQSEYILPRQLLIEALDAIEGIRDRIAAVLQVSEIRTIAADDLWLSPSYQRDSIAIHFTWIADARAVTPVIADVEERLAPLGARPHWGKLFGTSPEALRALYERFGDFIELSRDYDPEGKFRNELVEHFFPVRW